MNITKLSDKNLLEKTFELRKSERKIMNEILEHLKEIHSRRLYADLGYSSLDKFMMHHLRYSESATWRRIRAMKLSQKTPVVGKMLETGELNLTSAGKAQTAIANSSLDVNEVLAAVKNKSGDDLEKAIFDLGGNLNITKREFKKRVSSNEVKLSVILKEDVIEKLERLKAHKKKSSEEVINEGLDMLMQCFSVTTKRCDKKSKSKTSGRTISRPVRSQLMMRAGYMCEYKNCNERMFLEIDHIKPYAMGGSNELENLRLLCRTHNQRAAIKSYGQKHMQQFL